MVSGDISLSLKRSLVTLILLTRIPVVIANDADPEAETECMDSSGCGPGGPVTWQVQWHNDGYASSDNQFTSGFSARKHSMLASSLAETSGTPAFGKPLARLFIPDDPGLNYRETWAVGQNLQTPDILEIEEIILNDVPYVGMIGWSSAFTAFDDTDFSGFGLLLGWVGESALGEPTQKLAHRISGAAEPQGWDHQLDFEPLVNAYFMKKHRLWNQPKFDAALNWDVALGNFFTLGEVALELRVGKAPDGFTFLPTPIGRGLDYDATLREPGESYTYISLVTRATAFGYSLPLEGNLLRKGNQWTENHVIDMERVVTQIIFGVHRERAGWGIHLNFWFSSDTVEDNGRLLPSENPRNSFGTITFEWRP